MAKKKLKVVLAGCGGIAGAWMNTPTVKKKVEMVGLVDIKQESAENFKEKHGLKGAVTGTDLAGKGTS
ncbi:MAG: hypothetical protein HQL31_07265 [Planctomycetes bacterium]|nr:hypothetical protein [Planctomycetota bacterium]